MQRRWIFPMLKCNANFLPSLGVFSKKKKKSLQVHMIVAIPQMQISFIDGNMELQCFSGLALIFKLRIILVCSSGN